MNDGLDERSDSFLVDLAKCYGFFGQFIPNLGLAIRSWIC